MLQTIGYDTTLSQNIEWPNLYRKFSSKHSLVFDIKCF